MNQRLAWCVVLSLLIAHNAFGQAADVTGSVTDQTGGSIPGATVTLSNAESRRSTTTSVAGDYRFPAVAPGTYELSILMPGFAALSRSGIVVAEGSVTVPPIQLAIATVGEEVVVSASRVESQLINAPATLTVLSGSSLALLPAQNFGDILRSVPGVNVVQLS